MNGLVQHLLTRIISFLIVVCLTFSPIANGAMLSTSSDSHASIDVEQRCHHAVKHDAHNSTSPIFVTTQINSCKHSPACSLLCAIAIELSVIDVSTLTQEDTITWSTMDYLNFTPSFLSRLDKPPKA